MKITLLCIGKTDDKYLIEGIDKYLKRLKFYITFNLVVIPDIKNSKNLTQDQQKEKEAQLLQKYISAQDTVVLLDEFGKEYRSIEFSSYLEKNMINSIQHLIFIIGGPYGFDDQLYQRANHKISLSKMTFSHQMIRLFFVEQVYRAFSILKGEPYHHE
ncbi:23S rRNA (pseudouridine(1915)-N(3))-methyltransferase RlmH [Sphingobacterium sp. SRCM116780]|uniref:23S rRNA (pseudouridine(1915)-N(3))-methyltransferase RlmH n=1 Tax=Sphingobacterium sp. SRCM116780 TaxID=2907623 RepID=UPI001F458501|nr:23S rRNA (pseudouridine(1915)-N(3))-methyltransferase RlmH [Sphingobacterium sp. SRCM116780]UIR54566.1 23S rRNA (pseudouridine(1915)-N(3))-methyltransferase RlmH [Sphingobacterium sp. SRCM116780]